MKKTFKIAIVVAMAIICLANSACTNDHDYSSSDSDYSSSSSSSSSSHDCYVCGDDGNIKYGSHYYCATHYAYVKTVVDNS